jgi:anti-sigma B factor antagonist
MPLEEFVIEQENLANDAVVVVRVSGYLDAHTFEQLEETISDLFNKGSHRLLVDLSKVDYISSAGAGVFIGALSEAQEHNGNIVLMKPTPNVREVFDLLGLTQIFQVVDDQEAALKLFRDQ